MHTRATIAVGVTCQGAHDYATLQTIRERAEVNSTDQIALLEGTHGQLLAQQMQLEKKIGEPKGISNSPASAPRRAPLGPLGDIGRERGP